MEESASKKRRLLAVYIDYLLFAAVAAPAMWIAQSRGIDVHWAVVFVAFAVVDSLLIKILGTSPGSCALGILRGEGTPMVDEWIKRTERWWTMLLGVGLILEGAKNLVRWTEGLPPLPVFGPGADEGAFLLTSLFGAGNIVAGLAILRCRSFGPLIGVAVFLAEGTALALSWPRIDAWLVERVSMRRQMQGRSPVPAEDLEGLQTFFYGALIAGLIVSTILLISTYVRFRRAERARASVAG